MKPIDRAISVAGTQAALARSLEVLPQHINNWKKRGVPADRCIAIEEATQGKVTRYDLRPDVFGAPAQAA